MKIDDLNIDDATDDFAIVVNIWDDLGNMEEKGILKCDYCKKLLNYLNKRFS